MDWYTLQISQTLKNFNTNPETGLNSQDVNKQKLKFGSNTLTQKKKKNFFSKVLSQFSDFMVIILLFAAVISFFTSTIEGNSDYIDAIIILFIVMVNAIIGASQESKAEKAIEALSKLSAPSATVIRNGNKCKIDSEDVVPGDILVLSTGDFICADARLIKSINLKTEESALTGESLPVEKSAMQVYPTGSPVSAQKNMVFSASAVTLGHGLAVVVETGMNTQVGKIAHMINEEASPQTPLQQKLASVGKSLGLGALAICAVIFLLGILQSVNVLEMFMISISLAVAAIPEGLPAIVTIVLALGVRAMAANRAIVRKLPAVETLGSASVICSDKTGTLTQNKMTVTKLSLANNFIDFNSSDASELLSLATLCNNCTLSGKKGSWNALGEPTESAIVLAAANIGREKQMLDSAMPRTAEIPFDSKRKLMTTIHKLKNGDYRIITKGAPDMLLPLCSSSRGTQMDDNLVKKIELQNKLMAKEALRVLAVAYKDVQHLPSGSETVERDLSFYGLIGMIDPPRPQAKQAVQDCKLAGIKPVMITGDHVITAQAIAKDLGILGETDLAMTGTELENMSQEDLQKNIYDYAVFARVSPEHKVRIVKAFQKSGAVVAMTGDGVNDAPALKVADIGCAMGLSGTDVAKGAADMIMTDDNFATIVEAVRQGRGIYENIRRTVYYLLSSNIGEIVIVLTAFLFGMPTPLVAIQLLWVNLISDSFPALALGAQAIDEDVMKRKPIKKKQGFFANGAIYSMAIEGAFIGAISLLAFVAGRIYFDAPDAAVPVFGRTMAFTVLSLSQVFHAFNVRTDHSIFRSGLGNSKMILSSLFCILLQLSVVCIPEVSKIFKTVNLDLHGWIIAILLSLTPIFVVETEKFFERRSKIKAKGVYLWN